MNINWKHWCRLCACENSIVKVASEELSAVIQKFTTLGFFSSESICQNCLEFLNTIQKFSERCCRVEKMFSDLLMMDENTDFSNIKFMYGVADEWKFSELENFKLCQNNSNPLKSNKSTDTSDLDVVIKQENGAFEADVMVCSSEFTSRKLSSVHDESFDQDNEELNDESNNNTDRDLESFIEDNDCDLEDPAFELREEEDLNQELKIEHDTELGESVEGISNGHSWKIDYDCHICSDTKFDNFHALISHCKEQHQENPKVKCSCGKILSSRVSLGWHKKLHSSSNEIYKCKICNKIYNRRQSYLTHLRNSHKEKEEGLFVCSKCPKSFSSEKKVKVHEQVHLPDDQKMVHPCPYCNKKFTKSVNVQAHIKAIHIGDRPFICEGCGKSFGTKGALKEHQITHSEDRPFSCSFCDKKFKNLPRLRTHEDIHNETNYICPHCGLQLNTKRTLKMHLVVHSDQKKYKCHYCGNEFKRSKALKNHLILHTGLRPYSCPFCEKTFANGSNCRSHKKKAHPEELAALEASGEQPKVTNIPKLEHLQPKPHQIQQIQMQMQGMIPLESSDSILLPSLITQNGDVHNSQVSSQALPSLIHTQQHVASSHSQQAPQTILQLPSNSSIQIATLAPRLTDTSIGSLQLSNLK